MSSVLNMIRNYVINSEEDIPTEYREEIEQKLKNEPKEIQLEATQLTPGILGTVLSEENEIKDVFKDNSVCYFGHGTTGDETILVAILQNGLKTVNPKKNDGNTLRGLDSTTIVFDRGSDQLFEKEKEKLENWPHKSAQNVVIVSLPKDYILKYRDVGSSGDRYKPFYVGSDESGFYLRPEFIKGIYNAKTHSFTENANFYQNLNEETQKKLFEDIKMAYIMSYAEFSNFNPRETIEPLPLNEQEMEKLSIEWYKEQLKKLREDKTFDEQDLNEELHGIANEMIKTDFEDTTRSLKDDVRDSQKGDLYKENDEWEASDEWF